MYCDPLGPGQVMHKRVQAHWYRFVCTDSCVQPQERPRARRSAQELAPYSRAFRGYTSQQLEKTVSMHCDPPSPCQVTNISVQARRYRFVCTDSCVQDRKYRFGCRHSCVQVRTYRLVCTDSCVQVRMYRFICTGVCVQARGYRQGTRRGDAMGAGSCELGAGGQGLGVGSWEVGATS